MEKTDDKFADLKPGTRVVMQTYVGGTCKDCGVRTVARLTPAQIILAPEGTYDRFHRVGGVRKYPGQSISGIGRQSIARIATQAEIYYWAAIEQKIKAENEAFRLKREAHERKRYDLAGMFSESVIVRESNENGKWEVEFGPLTEFQVGKLAALVKGSL